MTTDQTAPNQGQPIPQEEIGFQWWVVWAWLGLTLGNLLVLGQLHNMIGLALFLIVINSVLMIMILRFNKYAFLVATIISLNPILWIVNGIYLKRRWQHPKVNIASSKPEPNDEQTVSQDVPITQQSKILPPLPSKPDEISPSEEEKIYEQAGDEIGSDTLKKGLWAKSLAESDGNEGIAKARYIRSRSQQLLRDLEQQRQNEYGERLQAAEAARQAHLIEQQKAEAAVPKGACPNCSTILPLSATTCPACHADFSGVNSWKPIPSLNKDQ